MTAPPVAAPPIVDFFADVLRFPLYPLQAEIVGDVYSRRVRMPVINAGRRSGKDRMAAGIAVYEATANAKTHLDSVPAGESPTVVVIATSIRQARLSFSYVRQYLAQPALSGLVANETETDVTLHNGMRITVLPCTSRSARGFAVPVAVLSECAWFSNVDGSPMSLEEVLDSVVPATAQFRFGRVILISSPRWATDEWAELCRRAATGEHGMRLYHGTTADLNPGIPADFLAAEYAKDPAMARREYGAEFVSGLGSVFDEETVRRAVAGHLELPPRPGLRYVVAVDAAYTGDTFAVVVAHREGDQLYVDRVLGWRGSKGAPVDHRLALDEVAAVSRAYNGADVCLDQYAAEPIAQGLTERGVRPVRKPWRNELKTDAVTALRQLFYQDHVRLPRHAALTAELVALEQRPLPSGRVRISAPPGQHDDYAHALLAATHHLGAAKKRLRSVSRVREPQDPALDAWRYMP